jgi:mono/diheme cytochrome c family protein
VNESIFFILAGVFIVSALAVGMLAATGRDVPDRAIPPLVGWLGAVAVATVVFALLYGNEGSGEPVAKASVEYLRPGQSIESPAEEAEGEKSEEEAEEAPNELEQESSVADAGEQLEGKAGAEGGQGTGGDAKAGAAVFTENCTTCHGATGHGGNGGPDLRTMPLAQSEAGAIEQVTNGGGGMPAFAGTLSEEEIEDVSAYVVEEVVNGGGR